MILRAGLFEQGNQAHRETAEQSLSPNDLLLKHESIAYIRTKKGELLVRLCSNVFDFVEWHSLNVYYIKLHQVADRQSLSRILL